MPWHVSRLSGFRFKPRHGELLETAYAAADGTMDLKGLVTWIEAQL